MTDIVERLRWEADRLPLKFSKNSELFDLLTEAAETIENLSVESPVYDKEEIHHGCTVQILTETSTGRTSLGWWPEKEKIIADEKPKWIKAQHEIETPEHFTWKLNVYQCPKCGYEVIQPEKRCEKCGTELEANNE